MTTKRTLIIATAGLIVSILSSAFTSTGDIVVPILAIVLVPISLICIWIERLKEQSSEAKWRAVLFTIALVSVTFLHVLALTEWIVLLAYHPRLPGFHRSKGLVVMGLYSISILSALMGRGWQRVSLALAGFCSLWAFMLPMALD